ncbi:MAG TPA: glycosyltransferase family 2 protein [Pedobacter sp.]|uniref:glycosyltransferase family 2 protein n=1 Tax=Pedobacter sp. TaxID=1411316 RepID=UPI002C12E67C|nr:glycosyltransferase family 2 protein [Pedobacter sp.]HMI00860.1 glycosyltransferase family 2 protein [Pedobacter sp.]
MDNYRASVCMATYNGEKYIYDQIKSILDQLRSDDELIISDDQSKDHTISIIESFNDPRIKLFLHKNVGRPTENFQNALEKAEGEIIFLADQDDVWIEGKYEKMRKLLKTYDLVLSNSILVDEDLKVLNSSFFHYHGSAKGVVRNAIKNSYFGSCMAFRKGLLQYALPFPSTLEIGHDIWLGLVAEMTGNVYFTNEAMILYRRHGSTVTPHGIGKSKRSLFVKLWSRIIVLKYVLKFYLKYLKHARRISVHNNTNV